MDKLSRRNAVKLTGSVGILSLAGCTDPSQESALSSDVVQFMSNSTLVTSPSCVCCDEYVEYLQDNGVSDISVEKIEDYTQIKHDAEIPQEKWSCHTIETEEYIIEGHVPLEAIEQLEDERPDIQGIGLAGMPSGSPGMGGSKTETFEIYAINNDGTITEFMEL